MIRGLFENPAEQEQGALRRLYTGLDLPRGATPEDLLRAYEARTGLSTDTPVGAYLALSRLRAGALAAGDPDRAAALAARMETLAAHHPGLAGEHGARIAMLALHSLRPNQQPMIADLASLEFRLGTSLARLRPPAALPYDEADLDQATRTVLGEAADQGPLGRQAVAHVIANRLRDDRWPDTVTAVVRQPRQFSAWNTDGSGNALVHLPASDPLYQQVRAEVRAVFDGQLPDPTGGAVHYYAPRGMTRLIETGHAQSPTPPWLATATAERNTPPVTIRDHVFTGQARN